MPRWKALPEELDPEVKELTAALRMLVDRGGSGIAAVADSTGYSRTSWERYLNGRLLPPKGAVIALAEVTGVNPLHLTTLWELAERSWSRAEMRHDLTIEAMRIAQAREGLGRFAGPSAQAPATASAGPVTASDPAAAPAPSSTGASASSAGRASASAAPHEPYDRPGAAPYDPQVAAGSQARASTPAAATAPGTAAEAPPPPTSGAGAVTGGVDGPRAAPGRAHRAVTFLAGTVGALLIVGAAVFLTQADPEDEARAADHGSSSAPAGGEASLPDGVRCQGAGCAGEDPEAMGCGGQRATTGRSITVGTAVLEVRFSEVCGAAWARVTGAATGDTVTIGAEGARARERKAQVGQDPDAYTPMVAVRRAQDAKACITPAKGRTACTG
ncbi:DUF2690 domain-containing protein [Streptomyces sp. CO7]